MTEQAAQPEKASRSLWTTALIAAFGGPFAGFLWIGAGRLALISLLVITGATIAICYIGFPVIPGMDLAAVGTYSGYGLMIVWIAIVLPFAGRFKPDKWYARGVSVFVLVFYASIVAALVTRTFLFQSFSTPSGSMVPTLVNGDYFFASKFAYGYGRYTVPLGLLPFEGRIFGAEPKRGDIVLFRPPSEPDIDYVKRVVGLPGDKIQMVGGVLHINDAAVGLEDIGPYSSDDGAGKEQRETLPNGVSYLTLSLTDRSVGDDTMAWTVPENEYFMLGDNRDNSNDSRFRMGTIPFDNLVGKAVRLFWNSKGTDYSSRQALDAPAGQ